MTRSAAMALLVAGIAGLLAVCKPADGGSTVSRAEPAPPAPVLQLRAQVRASYPHDPAAWTQGLLWDRDRLYESTGHYGQSTIRRVRLADGIVEAKQKLGDEYFGEGLAKVGEALFQLTWRSGRGFRYESETLSPVGEFAYEGQGWGLCFDGASLVRSDGTTAALSFHRPEDFALERQLTVSLEGVPLSHLNELECAEGWIYANVWMKDQIVRIDPNSGVVTAVIDASGLLTAEESRNADVLNGIAYYPPGQSFFVTGKNWPRLFEVVFVSGSG